MARQKQKRKRDKKRNTGGPVGIGSETPTKSPLTEAWRSRVMQGAVRRGERQPGRSS